ncbi:hypothetical protein TCAL_06903 [Tigriopus californicus]|uniref:Uncharacterized protein n=2 Tax=Tigriopus californicus TaxID=6832 RepID=A0A553PL61_TIGCA|nr:hypothetical protein TCAL_06903 [Tigriopus californicus]
MKEWAAPGLHEKMEDTLPVRHNATNTANEADSTGEPTHLSASSILVFQPGSRFLRFGRALDATPQVMLHCLARRRKGTKRDVQGTPSGGSSVRESSLPPLANLDGDQFQSLADSRIRLAHALERTLQSTGVKRYSVPLKHLREINDRVKPEVLPDSPDAIKTLMSQQDVIVGDEVLQIPNHSREYNIHFPFKSGDVNRHSGIGGSQSAILMDLKAIWSHVIKYRLHIPLSDLAAYRAVLVIPALYQRSLIKHYLSLMLLELGFGGCFVIQDHVAATFGAGLGFACVVDIGDQKTSVSCVEDGISQPDSRVQINYGSGDITQILYFFLRSIGFPYKACKPDLNLLDAELLQKLKEDVTHLDLDQCGITEWPFNVRALDKPVNQYKVSMADEPIIASLALFNPELFEVTGSKRVQMMGKDPGDPEDPHDHIYLNETSRKYTKAGPADVADSTDPPGMEDDLEIVADVVESGQNGRSGGSKSQGSASNGESVLSLDQAILRSIEGCESEDMKRKMYGCILLVGGGSKLKGLDSYLRGKLALQIPMQYRTDPVDIIVNAKDLCSAMTTWKGAAILACLETAQELWITAPEWAKTGQKLLRERAPFPWA